MLANQGNAPAVSTSAPAMDEAELEVAARSALDNAVPSANNRAIFAPFEVFCWPGRSGEALPQAKCPRPVGATPEEARCVAWLLSASAHLDAEVVLDVAKKLAYAAKLSRDAIAMDTIYTELATAALAPGGPCRGLVRFADVERVLGVRWLDCLVETGGVLKRVDPYFRAVLDGRVRRSVEEHVWALERALSSLPGLANGQTNVSVDGVVDTACRLAIQRLQAVVLRPDGSLSMLTAEINRLAEELLPSVVLDAKTTVQSDMCGVRALSMLVATGLDHLEERMQTIDEAVAILVHAPPTPLVEQFADRNIGFDELRAAFPSGANPGCGSTTGPPTSLGVRTSILACWLHSFAASAQEACVATMATLQRAAQRATLLASWSDTELCPVTQAIKQSAAWPPPTYTVAPNTPPVHAIVATRSDGTALRVARLLATLLHEAQTGLLPVGVVHQSVLAPLIARVRAEREVALGACVSRELKPVGERVGVAWPSGPKSEPVPATVVLQAPAPTPAKAVVAALSSGVTLPASLVRDHFLLSSIFKALQRRRGHASIHVALNEIVSTARELSDVLRAQTNASVVQSTRWVCVKVVERTFAQLQNRRAIGTVEYRTGRTKDSGERFGGIVAEGEGVDALLGFVHSCLVQMQTNGVAFAAQWHVSRSARSRCVIAIGKRVRSRGDLEKVTRAS